MKSGIDLYIMSTQSRCEGGVVTIVVAGLLVCKLAVMSSAFVSLAPPLRLRGIDPDCGAGWNKKCRRRGTRMQSSGSVQYVAIQHAGMLVENTEKAKEFYMEVFGMEDDTALRNPKLPFHGAFLKAGSSQIHLMELPSVDPKTGRPAHGGR